MQPKLARHPRHTRKHATHATLAHHPRSTSPTPPTLALHPRNHATHATHASTNSTPFLKLFLHVSFQFQNLFVLLANYLGFVICYYQKHKISW